MKRIFLIVLDSFGIGEMEDAAQYGDKGVNTIRSVSASPYFHLPNMRRLGLFNIDGVTCGESCEWPEAVIARMKEASKGKDTTIGHWEIAGICSENPLPTYPNGFPKEILEEFSKRTGRGVLCNAGSALCRKFGKPELAEEIDTKYGLGDSIAEEYERLTEKDRSQRRSNSGPSL